jgi:hypothetical protein
MAKTPYIQRRRFGLGIALYIAPISKEWPGRPTRLFFRQYRPPLSFDVRRATGETMDKIASLQDHLKAFA